MLGVDPEDTIENVVGFLELVIRNRAAIAPAVRQRPFRLLEQDIDRFGIDAGKGFVEKDVLGFGSECTGDFCSSALAARERIAAGIANMSDSKFLQQLLQTRQPFASPQAHGLKHGEYVLGCSHLAED